jgi:peroxiredoxin
MKSDGNGPRRVLPWWLVALVAAAGCSGGGSAARPTTGGSAAGGSAPDFALDDLDGNEFRLSEHLGESVHLLNFWATWCEPCRVEMPHLNRFQETYGDRGLRVLAISMDGPESVSRVRSHVARYEFALTVLLDLESEVTQLYNPRRAAPYNALIGRDGDILWSHEGYAPGDEEELEEQIQAALGVE